MLDLREVVRPSRLRLSLPHCARCQGPLEPAPGDPEWDYNRWHRWPEVAPEVCGRCVDEWQVTIAANGRRVFRVHVPPHIKGMRAQKWLRADFLGWIAGQIADEAVGSRSYRIVVRAA